jgi:hypothetical protein
MVRKEKEGKISPYGEISTEAKLVCLIAKETYYNVLRKKYNTVLQQ